MNNKYRIDVYDSRNSCRVGKVVGSLAEARKFAKIAAKVNTFTADNFHGTAEIQVGKAVINGPDRFFEEWEWTSETKRVERVSWSA